jgi:hypothetical protein
MPARMRPRVNADVGGRPDEKDIRTDIFIQKHPLGHPCHTGDPKVLNFLNISATIDT